MSEKINVFWFRRDLRLHDNHGLFMALRSGLPVLPIFIFDKEILSGLPKDDARVSFIHNTLKGINQQLQKVNSSLFIKHDHILEAWKKILDQYEIQEVFTNHDYEPYALNRDKEVQQLLEVKKIGFHTFKDQVIFEKGEITKADGTPYTIYTPYKNKWLEKFSIEKNTLPFSSEGLSNHFFKKNFSFPTLEELGFSKSEIDVSPFEKEYIKQYDQYRDIPYLDRTTRLGTHLRFGTISVRQVVQIAAKTNQVFLSELIWREFFMMILFYFPQVVHQSFKPKYDNIKWLNNEQQFKAWCNGETGYPMVDAGMNQLNQTGFMHNRVRMVVASFLCKHLLIDWRWGEAYFAEKLLDYELSSNNGNWQWAAGCGCDAAPYFRVFNPTIQLKKFDPDLKYIKKWLPEFNSLNYPQPIVDHSVARDRAISTYKSGIAM
ncbi:deoxyribodipyrimidine photo-lyase [Reichenbachiella sp. MALMAid0571]|uniref:cryptochrome/photolyase family protein n=1 Tax=Reichenbachiella sp. MALMAid0571 TaxID=3143939 RepID=UPI0032DEEE99